ncbi:hypothetical protein [Methylobacter sp. BlB1]|jgi:hypothetical protein|uniref:hypothetical protein n=1 Tax=Methylobacter sp. BlB1 TaxID=2785914 RepID=UPI0018937167|nr:hypothetical protein [Methylobacter sp. BlB1]MBF6649513.1 hypothetical protein [Methylobacter sp. BlB1]
MSPIDFSKQQIEKIRDCNNAISAIAHLLLEFQVDSECGDEISKSIKNGYVIGGLLDALKVASETSDLAAEWLEEERMHRMNAEQAETEQ